MFEAPIYHSVILVGICTNADIVEGYCANQSGTVDFKTHIIRHGIHVDYETVNIGYLR